MEFTINQIAEIISGKVKGDGSELINKFNKIEEGEKGSISFLANPKYEGFLYESQASAVIISNKLKLKTEPKTNLILVDDPYLAFTLLLKQYEALIKTNKKGIEENTIIEKEVILGENIYIGASSSIGTGSIIGNNSQINRNVTIGKNVIIGQNCILHTGVRIYDGVKIDNNCIIHSNAVIGADGFGFAPNQDGTYTDIPQLGNVILEKNVSIGANTTIDRATMGSTIIGEGTKIDNLVQIGHNVVIGKNTVIAAQTGISGSAKIGNNCKIGGQVGIAGHISIPNNTMVAAKAGVTKSFRKEHLVLSGFPATINNEFLKQQAILRNLPELLKNNGSNE